MPINPQMKIGKIVADDMRKADVFNRYKINFCCSGNISLKGACEEKGIDPNRITSELENLQLFSSGSVNRFNNWKPGFLLDYIVENHHAYLKQELPEIGRLLEKVIKGHGEKRSELKDIALHFDVMKTELENHLEKEEQILFPSIKEIIKTAEGVEDKPLSKFGRISQPVSVMEKEHESTDKYLENIRRLSTNYRPPQGACNSHKLLFHKLHELEVDLHQHIHLENNILFLKAVDLEKEVYSLN